MNLKFIKESDERWFVDLPEYDGPHEALEMVAGADALCDILSFDRKSVSVTLTEALTEFTTVILHRWLPFEETEGSTIGAYYRADFESNVREPFDIWLCPVTLFIFGEYPNVFYIQHTT